jgi:hypothetical protein
MMANRRHIQYIRDYYDHLQQQIHAQILSEKDDVILYSDTEQLLEYYVANSQLRPIEFNPELTESFEHKKELRRVPADQRQGPYRNQGDLTFEYESIVVTVPILPNGDIERIMGLQSSTYSTGGMPQIGFTNDAIHFAMDINGYGYKHDDEKVASDVKHALESVKRMIGWINTDINSGNSGLMQSVRTLLNDRKAKLIADQSRIASLVQKINIPLKQKIQEAATRIKLDPKPIVQKLKPNPKMPEEYVLDQSKVLDIISVIDNQGRQFEKTPKTYRDLEEEGLRDIILVGLNSLFEGKATGETFANRGKTDIYLNIDKGNVLTAECKLWSGKALYLKTIDQLLGYLTWRQNFGIMITFVKQKNLSKLLQDVPACIKEHASYRSGCREISQTHFASNHTLPQDENKNVEIHHLFYNLYVGHGTHADAAEFMAARCS